VRCRFRKFHRSRRRRPNRLRHGSYLATKLRAWRACPVPRPGVNPHCHVWRLKPDEAPRLGKQHSTCDFERAPQKTHERLSLDVTAFSRYDVTPAISPITRRTRAQIQKEQRTNQLWKKQPKPYQTMNATSIRAHPWFVLRSVWVCARVRRVIGEVAGVAP